MMKLKDTINFKTLREKGPAAIDVKGDEVVQIISKGSEIKVIISQDHYLNLLSAYNQLLNRAGTRQDELVNFEDRLQTFEEKLSKILHVTEEKEEEKKWRAGRKKVGNS